MMKVRLTVKARGPAAGGKSTVIQAVLRGLEGLGKYEIIQQDTDMDCEELVLDVVWGKPEAP
jgi:hypothetical protein